MDGRSKGRATPGRTRYHKVGLQGKARILMCAMGGHTMEGTGDRVEHKGFDGGWQGQGGVGSPCEKVSTRAREADPPQQGGTGSRFGGQGRTL